MLPEYSVQCGEEPYVVHARVLRMGSDLVVALWGGEAHVGAVAVAQPRASLRGSGGRAATASVIALLGHKEDEVAKRSAEVLAAALDRTVVVTAGMHWNGLTEDGVAAVAAACAECTSRLVAKLTGS